MMHGRANIKTFSASKIRRYN